jgi:hypothetical protein
LLLAINSIAIFPSYGQTPNFQGKTMTIDVGTVAGDLDDLYARAIALFMEPTTGEEVQA